MRLASLSDNVILIKHRSQLSANTYLIECRRGELIMIDPGLPDALDFYVSKLKGKYRRIYIIHTHMHYDHIASTATLREVLGDYIEVYHHVTERGFLESGDSITTLASLFGSILKPIKVDRALIEGTLNVGGEELRVVHTPGHTVGSICLIYRDIAFTGDTLFSDGSPGRVDLPTGDKDLLRKSLLKLMGLDVRLIAPGHGSALETNFKELTKMALLRLGYR